MDKITNYLFVLFAAVLIWQSGCASGSTSGSPTEIGAINNPATPPPVGATNNSATPPPTPLVIDSALSKNVSTDLKTAELEARALLDNGIKFDITVHADGGTDDGGVYTGHGYVTPDGVDISTDRAIYMKEKNAKKDYESYLKDAAKILKKERIDGSIRVVATEKKSGWFMVIYSSGTTLYVYQSPSLKHLLAFEKWRDG